MERFSNRARLRKALIVVSVIVVVALGALAFFQYREIQKLRSPETASEQQALQLKSRVSKLMQLPDEPPTVATVKDEDALRSQEFFKDSKEGDKVLIFPEAKKAVIYRESDNRIINSGPIVISSD